MVSSMCGGNQALGTKVTRHLVQRQVCLAYSLMGVVGASWSGAAWVLRHWGATVHWGNHECQHVIYWSRAWSPSFGNWDAGQYSNMITTSALYAQACLQTLTLLSICGASSNGRWRSARSLVSTSSVMSSWRSGRGLQWQPVKLWRTPCPRVLRQCWKIMVATRAVQLIEIQFRFRFGPPAIMRIQ